MSLSLCESPFNFPSFPLSSNINVDFTQPPIRVSSAMRAEFDKLMPNKTQIEADLCRMICCGSDWRIEYFSAFAKFVALVEANRVYNKMYIDYSAIYDVYICDLFNTMNDDVPSFNKICIEYNLYGSYDLYYCNVPDICKNSAQTVEEFKTALRAKINSRLQLVPTPAQKNINAKTLADTQKHG